eukprot:TRINITY_DN76483_c0_g1_i1.p1 TRINITY_DN76483_c0_g1~~TRINITY_DN76483_c0_g1_i1.p1  ORF type:complete len:272 (+),score=92.41 TRINITY_DN76483_c0_g1_i1:125-940(+)
MSFKSKASDELIRNEIDRLFAGVKKNTSSTAESLDKMERDLDDVRRRMLAWRDLRPDSVIHNRLPEADCPAPFSNLESDMEHWDDLERALSFGLKWEKQQHVPKRRRRNPPPKGPGDLPPIQPCPSLIYELKRVAKDAEQLFDFVSDFGSLMDLITPPPVEGSDMPVLLNKVKSRIVPIRSALKAVQTMYLDFLECRVCCEEEYYKNHMTSDWNEVIDALDFASWQKVIRSRRLFIRVVAFTSCTYQQNEKNIEKFVHLREGDLQGPMLVA